jgi:hypothetical protein
MTNVTITTHNDCIVGKSVTNNADLRLTTKEIYKNIFDIIKENNFYLYKCNNYIPNILKHENGVERYHLFNQGRREAWQESNYTHKPAACALGSTTDNLEISFIAGPTLPIEVENPRQISAYNYPPKYGYPLFARAVNVNDKLYVSGTASVVGHETAHVNNLVAQYYETIANLKIVIGNKNLDQFNFIVYIKNKSDLPIIQKLFQYPAKFVVCDICRTDLLLEIEATEI